MAGVANTAGLSGGDGGGLGAPHGGGNPLASSDSGSLHKAGDRDAQVTNGLQDAAASWAQLEDELVLRGEEMSWSGCMGQRPTKASAPHWGDPYLTQIRLGLLGFGYLGAKSPLCI
jgi:hypothetical protein